MGAAERLRGRVKGYFDRVSFSDVERLRNKMVYKPSREKSWHKDNVSNGTPNLVAPTIDALCERITP